jgi:hypothetical protein
MYVCVQRRYQAEHALHAALDNLCEVENNNNDPSKNEFVPRSTGTGYVQHCVCWHVRP